MPNDHQRAARQMNMPLRGGVPRRRGAASFNQAVEATATRALGLRAGTGDLRGVCGRRASPGRSLHNAMRLLSPVFALIMLVGCRESSTINQARPMTWSETSVVQQRQKAAVIVEKKEDETWVAISTAKLNVTDIGFVCSDGEILSSGFYTYPGGDIATNIQEAVVTCSRIPGARFSSEPDGAVQLTGASRSAQTQM